MDSTTNRISRGLATTTSRRRALKLIGGGLIGTAMAGAGFAAVNNAAAQSTSVGTAQLLDPASGDPLGAVSGLVATLDDAGGIDISGVFTDTAGNTTEFTTSLLDGSGTCDILNLVLGPLDLNILGLDVFLDTVILEITAESGAGNLLGNLLCAVAGLLDDNVLGSALADLLNQIFSLLG